MAAQAAQLHQHRQGRRLALWRVSLHNTIAISYRVLITQTFTPDRTFAQNIGNLYRSPDLSVGFGLLYRLEPVRIEVNFSLPLIGRKGEGWARGLGVGLGLEFL
jgi:outer membrane protein insertion porin family